MSRRKLSEREAWRRVLSVHRATVAENHPALWRFYLCNIIEELREAGVISRRMEARMGEKIARRGRLLKGEEYTTFQAIWCWDDHGPRQQFVLDTLKGLKGGA